MLKNLDFLLWVTKSRMIRFALKKYQGNSVNNKAESGIKILVRRLPSKFKYESIKTVTVVMKGKEKT